jgi:hypothetical protein
MTSLLVRAIISLVVILAASELGRRFPRVGGFVLSLPLVSILSLVMSGGIKLPMGAAKTGRQMGAVMQPTSLSCGHQTNRAGHLAMPSPAFNQ